MTLILLNWIPHIFIMVRDGVCVMMANTSSCPMERMNWCIGIQMTFQLLKHFQYIRIVQLLRILMSLSFVRDIFTQIYGQESKDDSKTVELIYLK